jgi:AraC-like DNA-binding protein
MATAKPKVVSVVKRGPASDSATVTPVNPAAVARTTRDKVGMSDRANVRASKKTAAKAAASASRKAAVKPLLKVKPAATVVVPKVKREEPHVLKRDIDKPLIERLNPKLLEQLRSRKVTNAAAAEALGVHETYLSRVLRDMGETKTKGVTTEHREARAKLTHARQQTRDMLAKRVNKGEITVQKAAKDAACSVRTMFRHCAKFA